MEVNLHIWNLGSVWIWVGPASWSGRWIRGRSEEDGWGKHTAVPEIKPRSFCCRRYSNYSNNITWPQNNFRSQNYWSWSSVLNYYYLNESTPMCEGYCILGYDAVQSGRSWTTFRRNVPYFWGLKISQARNNQPAQWASVNFYKAVRHHMP
jgi:hypothetical protein